MIKVSLFSRVVKGKDEGEPLYLIKTGGDDDYVLTEAQFVQFNRSRQ